MNIWVIGRNYPSKANNFQGSFELEQAKMLAKHGNQVSYIACVLHPFWRIKDGGYCTFQDELLNVFAYSCFFSPHITYPIFPIPYFPTRRNKIWDSFLKKVELETGKPDVIHIHFPLMILSVEVFKKYHDSGIKVVVTEHWTKVQNRRLDKFEYSQLLEYLNLADEYLCVGYLLQQAIYQITKTNRELKILPNIVNEVFKPLENDEKQGFKFGIVGRLVSEKQMDKVIRQFARKFKNDSDVRLIIVGNGKEYKNLNKLVHSLAITSQVEFAGALKREETAAVLAKLDCLICFSKFETFGVPIIEAWACGIPVITTTADCITKQWNHYLGISVKHTDEDELGTAMEYMIGHIDEYDKNYISEYAQQNYSEDVIYNQLYKLYS